MQPQSRPLRRPPLAPMGRALPREVFLSHSTKDRVFALKVAVTIRDHGVPVWYGPTNITGAKQWHDEIGSALRRCDWFVVVLSPNAVRSEWVKRELMFVLNDSRYEERIIPVLYKPCNSSSLSWVLPAFQRVDFTNGHNAGCRDLLRIWGLGLTNAVANRNRPRHINTSSRHRVAPV